MAFAAIRRFSGSRSPQGVAQEYLPLALADPSQEGGEITQRAARNQPELNRKQSWNTITKILAFIVASVGFMTLARWAFGFPRHRFPPPEFDDFPGDDGPFPDHHPSETNDPLWSARADEVVKEFIHAYQAYERHAFPHDELQPLSKTSIDK